MSDVGPDSPLTSYLAMRFALILSLLIAIVAVIFAFYNPDIVNVDLIYQEVQSPMALVIIVSLLAGVLAGILASVPSIVRRGAEVRQLRRLNDELQAAHTSAVQRPYTEGPPPDDRLSKKERRAEEKRIEEERRAEEKRAEEARRAEEKRAEERRKEEDRRAEERREEERRAETRRAEERRADAIPPSSEGATETQRLAEETRRMAEDAKRRADELERRERDRR
jgi:uncharacterized integral membrane protein